MPQIIPPQFTIRECTTLEEFGACVELQRLIWQFEPVDVTPLRFFIITKRSGGTTLGAFDEVERLIGFAHMLPAFDEKNRPYYYSHMAAVDDRRQNAGIGLQLKLAQRDWAIRQNVSLIVWTFDPLQSRNAHFNLVKLGGVVRKYLANYYGNVSSSELHRGLDTDRLYVEWWVRSEHVARALDGKQLSAKTPRAVIEVPAEILEIKARDILEARRWQSQIRTSFELHFAEGLWCSGFERSRGAINSRYLLFSRER